jgi:hypothetical protein
MIEEWRDVVGYEGFYQVSDLGRVRSLDRLDSLGRPVRGRIRKQIFQTAGYLSLYLSRDGINSMRLVHQIVLETFVGPRPNETFDACHENDDKTNNTLKNLRWDTKKENNADRVRNGIHQNGERNPGAKLNKTDIERIRDLCANGVSHQKTAFWIGTTRANVGCIMRGETWKRAA